MPLTQLCSLSIQTMPKKLVTKFRKAGQAK